MSPYLRRTSLTDLLLIEYTLISFAGLVNITFASDSAKKILYARERPAFIVKLSYKVSKHLRSSSVV